MFRIVQRWISLQPSALDGGEVDAIGRVGAFVPRVHLGGGPALLVAVHNVRVKWLHIDVPDGAAGESPHLGFVFESSSNLRVEQAVKQEDKETLQRVEYRKNIEENQRVCVDCKDAKDPGNSENGQEDGHRLGSQLNCVGVSVNLVALPADPRYDPGHQYEDANVHHDDKHSWGHKGPDGSIRQRQPAVVHLAVALQS